MNRDTCSSARIFASLVTGSVSAEERIFHRYVHRLSRLARSRLTPLLAGRVDPEDIVMSAWRSFFVAAKADRFVINESGELWALLTKITLRKVYRTAEFHTAEKRSVRSELGSSDASGALLQTPNHQPTAEEVASLTEIVEQLLTQLNPQDRRIMELILQGETQNAIASELGISTRTVRRSMTVIREMAGRQFDIPDGSVPQFRSDDPPAERSSAEVPLGNSANEISFDQLTLVRMIGHGGTGKVYEARLKHSQQRMAVKFLHKSFRNDERAVERLLREAATISLFNHRGIVGLKGTGQTKGGVHFIAMQYIDGQNLHDAATGATIDQIVGWMIDTAEAVEHAHQHGIVHCDLKPSNVMVTSDHRIVLTDFGMAHSLRDRSSDRALAGTAPWMAPEQIDSFFGNIDARTDVYGLGALLYTLVFNRPPYSGKRTSDVLAQVVSAAMPNMNGDVGKSIPVEVTRICRECLSKSPADRPRSAAEIAGRLKSL